MQYTRAVTVGERVVAWQMDRRWDDLTSVEPALVAPALAALGRAQRVQIVQLFRPAHST